MKYLLAFFVITFSIGSFAQDRHRLDEGLDYIDYVITKKYRTCEGKYLKCTKNYTARIRVSKSYWYNRVNESSLNCKFMLSGKIDKMRFILKDDGLRILARDVKDGGINQGSINHNSSWPLYYIEDDIDIFTTNSKNVFTERVRYSVESIDNYFGNTTSTEFNEGFYSKDISKVPVITVGKRELVAREYDNYNVKFHGGPHSDTNNTGFYCYYKKY